MLEIIDGLQGRIRADNRRKDEEFRDLGDWERFSGSELLFFLSNQSL
jgi:hypothetical protein